MAAFDDEAAFGERAAPRQHVLGQSVDELSARELAERIETLRREIARLEAAIEARDATRRAASAFFKT